MTTFFQFILSMWLVVYVPLLTWRVLEISEKKGHRSCYWLGCFAKSKITLWERIWRKVWTLSIQWLRPLHCHAIFKLCNHTRRSTQQSSFPFSLKYAARNRRDETRFNSVIKSNSYEHGFHFISFYR